MQENKYMWLRLTNINKKWQSDDESTENPESMIIFRYSLYIHMYRQIYGLSFTGAAIFKRSPRNVDVSFILLVRLSVVNLMQIVINLKMALKTPL